LYHHVPVSVGRGFVSRLVDEQDYLMIRMSQHIEG